MKPQNERREPPGEAAAGAAEATRELVRLRQLTARVADATDAFTDMEFEEILARAAAALQTLVSGVRLRVLREHEREAGEAVQQGTLRLPNGVHTYGSQYVGPPEPIHFVAYGLDDADDTVVLLQIFFERLQRALQHAGVTAELVRQSRRDWLTGLNLASRLEEALRELNPLWSATALLAVQLPVHGEAPGDPEAQLKLRSFAQSLRLALGDEDRAYQLERNTIAILTAERELARVEATVTRLAPDARLAYALSGEATGSRLIELALSRVAGRKQISRQSAAIPAAGLHPVTVFSGTTTALTLLEQVAQDWLFRVPVSLVLDLPAGYALDALPAVNRPVLVVTDGASRGYLHDLADLEPDGLVFGGLDAPEVRVHLERIAAGERVYSGPILDRSQLFPREREVWRLVARGLDNQQIALELGISERTVANYFTGLKDKLHLSTRCAVALSYWGRLKQE